MHGCTLVPYHVLYWSQTSRMVVLSNTEHQMLPIYSSQAHQLPQNLMVRETQCGSRVFEGDSENSEAFTELMKDSPSNSYPSQSPGGRSHLAPWVHFLFRSAAPNSFFGPLCICIPGEQFLGHSHRMVESARALLPTNQDSVPSTISWRWPGVIPKHKPRK